MVFLSLFRLDLCRFPSLEDVSNTTKLLAPEEAWFEDAIDLFWEEIDFFEE